IQGITWWASHQVADRVQPGQRHCLSRASSALRSGLEMTRFSRPRSTSTEPDSKMWRVIEQSQAVRFALFCDIGLSWSTSAAEGPWIFEGVLKVAVSVKWGRCQVVDHARC